MSNDGPSRAGRGRPPEISGSCQFKGGCEAKARRRAPGSDEMLCGTHYQKLARAARREKAQTCSWPGCRRLRQWNKLTTRDGYCREHEWRLVAGDPVKRHSALKRLAENSLNAGGCWECFPTKGGHPRGRLTFKGFSWLPYRFVYVATVGQIPARREIDHLCGQGRCFNPYHLEIVTSSENKRREHERARGTFDRAAAIRRRIGEIEEDEEASAGVAQLASLIYPSMSVFVIAARQAEAFEPRSPDA